jgi:hypothetical protein
MNKLIKNRNVLLVVNILISSSFEDGKIRFQYNQPIPLSGYLLSGILKLSGEIHFY